MHFIPKESQISVFCFAQAEAVLLVWSLKLELFDRFLKSQYSIIFIVELAQFLEF